MVSFWWVSCTALCCTVVTNQGVVKIKPNEINNLRKTAELRTKGSWVQFLPAAPYESRTYIRKSVSPFFFVAFTCALVAVSRTLPQLEERDVLDGIALKIASTLPRGNPLWRNDPSERPQLGHQPESAPHYARVSNPYTGKAAQLQQTAHGVFR